MCGWERAGAPNNSLQKNYSNLNLRLEGFPIMSILKRFTLPPFANEYISELINFQARQTVFFSTPSGNCDNSNTKAFINVVSFCHVMLRQVATSQHINRAKRPN